MPSSFSRFLSAEELERVRELYFESLKDEGKPDEAVVESPSGAGPESSEAASGQTEESG
jgi:hypothetical protein